MSLREEERRREKKRKKRGFARRRRRRLLFFLSTAATTKLLRRLSRSRGLPFSLCSPRPGSTPPRRLCASRRGRQGRRRWVRGGPRRRKEGEVSFLFLSTPPPPRLCPLLSLFLPLPLSLCPLEPATSSTPGASRGCETTPSRAWRRGWGATRERKGGDFFSALSVAAASFARLLLLLFPSLSLSLSAPLPRRAPPRPPHRPLKDVRDDPSYGLEAGMRRGSESLFEKKKKSYLLLEES